MTDQRSIPRAPKYRATAEGDIIGPRGRALKPFARDDGYLAVTIYDAAGKLLTGQRVHVLVCEAFYGPRPSKAHVVAHGNGIRSDNRAANLRWATYAENAADMKLHGTHMAGEAHPRATLTWAAIEEIRAIKAANPPHRQRLPRGTIPSLAKKFGVKKSAIKDALIGRAWQP